MTDEQKKDETSTEEVKQEVLKEEVKKEETPKQKVEDEVPKKEEAPKEKTIADKSDKKVEVPAKFKGLIEDIEKMSIMDLAELVKILEKKFGVSPMVAATPVAGANNNGDTNVEEKSEFNIELKSGGNQKIQVIKVIKEITGKGLKEAKDIVDKAPVVVKENVKKEEAEDIKGKLETAGASVELK